MTGSLRAGLVFAVLVTLAAVLAASLVYGSHAALVTAEILGPLGLVTVLAGEFLARHRERLGSLRRQFGAVATLAGVQLAVAAGLLVSLMFVSNHDAFFAAIAVAYAGALGLWVSRRLTRHALDDVAVIRDTLAAVAEGSRDVRTGLRGAGELGVLGRDVDAMIERLDTEERARRSLIAAVSHDLRTPITSMRLIAEAVEDDLVEPEQRREYLQRLGTHVRALGSLVDDLFELTRLEAGDLRWSIEHVQLDALVAETVEAMRPHADASAVSMRAEPASGAVARGNPEQLQRVLFNLVQNAIRHTPADGSVTVRAERLADLVEVEVADTGAGIDGADRERVFEAFFQGGDRAARTDDGAGLGLAIARAIVEAHGGRIWLAEAASGTCVRFSLPAAA